MNQNLPVIGQALAKAGVKLPTQMQMVWTWLKDHPHMRIIDIRSSVPIPDSGVSSLLTQMHRRGMVKRVMEPSPRTKKMTPYYTAVGDVYELMPEPKNDGRAGGHKWSQNAEPVPAQPKHELALIERSTTAAKINSLTIGEARELYAELKKIFG